MAPHLPLEPHVSTPLPEHWTAAGTHGGPALDELEDVVNVEDVVLALELAVDEAPEKLELVVDVVFVLELPVEAVPEFELIADVAPPVLEASDFTSDPVSSGLVALESRRLAASSPLAAVSPTPPSFDESSGKLGTHAAAGHAVTIAQKSPRPLIPAACCLFSVANASPDNSLDSGRFAGLGLSSQGGWRAGMLAGLASGRLRLRRGSASLVGHEREQRVGARDARPVMQPQG
jgi:hypothetical protein